MELLDLPHDILGIVVSKLDTKSLVRFSSTCTVARHIAGSQKELRPLALSWRHTHHDSLEAWLKSPQNTERLRHLLFKCMLLRLETWLTGARNLVSLRLDYCRVAVEALPLLPPSLEHLRIHQLVPSRYSAFSTSQLSFLKNLRDLSITFSPAWALLVVTTGLPEELEKLELRNAATILLLSPPPASQFLHLRATYNFALNSTRLRSCSRHIKLSCEFGDVPLETLLPLHAGILEGLEVRCKDRFQAPVGHLTALTSLKCYLERLIIGASDLAALKNLKVLELDADKTAHIFGPLPEFARVSAGGKRLLPRPVLPDVVVPFLPFPHA